MLKTMQFRHIIEAVDEHQYFEAVWPREGQLIDGEWLFNEGHQDFEPLIIDAVTANLLITVHEALSPKNKRGFVDHIEKGRGSFGRMVDFSWAAVK